MEMYSYDTSCIFVNIVNPAHGEKLETPRTRMVGVGPGPRTWTSVRLL